MRTMRFDPFPLVLVLAPCFSSCSTEQADAQNDGSLHVLSCSLGCSDGSGGEQVFCSSNTAYRNQELSILFSEPIDIFSVNSSSFRVTDVVNGTSPSGQFFGDPSNPHRLIFRPSLFFDEHGNPVYGFEGDKSYEITIPGEAQNDVPPFIKSLTGRTNQSRMQCTIKTTLDVIDPVPGAPSVQVFADTVAAYDEDGNPIAFVQDELLNGGNEVTNIWRETTVSFHFDDVMNIATLVDPSSGVAPYITIEVDEDGDLTTPDRAPITGTFSFAVDLELLNTRLDFTSQLPFPSAGPAAPEAPRRIVFTIPASVQDLVANSVSEGGGVFTCIPELSLLGEQELPEGGEDFTVSWPTSGSNEDGRRGGAFWGGGRLTPGIGGGSGRLGDLILPEGVSLLLNTDSQTFPLTVQDGLSFHQQADVIGNADPAGFPDTLGNFPTSFTVTDGAFEFNRLVVPTGSKIRFEGSNPARVYVRGYADIQSGGLLDVSGVQPEDHDSKTISPEGELSTPTNAAGGGDGGFGADRFDMGTVNPNMGLLGLCENDVVISPSANTSGRKGMGVGRSVDSGTSGPGGGPGGAQYPVNYPIDGTGTDASNPHDLGFNKVNFFNVLGKDLECRSLMVGGAGSGGAYASGGGAGESVSVVDLADEPAGVANGAGTSDANDGSEIGIEPPAEDNVGYEQRLLEWTNPNAGLPFGYLRGGSGGGGGGGHPFGAFVHDPIGGTNCISASSFFKAWHDHSAARGGFGGGALSVVAGKRLTLTGQIDASGGKGGEARSAFPDSECAEGFFEVDFGQFATPGGGGSGGAVKLQSIVVNVLDTGNRINVSGGAGGNGIWTASTGGDGGTGLVRIEDLAGEISRASVAPSITPFDDFDNSLGWVSVDKGGGDNLADGPGWAPEAQRPDSLSASSSCWLEPDGKFFALIFIEDEEDSNSGDPEKMGWNMDVIYDPDGNGDQIVPFRGANSVLMNSWENEFGTELGTDGSTGQAAPIVVRFQGARQGGDFDPCEFDLNDVNSGLVSGSITPWVDHPAMLNDFATTPNLIRFVILFDGTIDGVSDNPGDVLSTVKGVTNLRIRCLPD